MHVKAWSFFAESDPNWYDTFFKVNCSNTVSNQEVLTFRKEYIFKWSFLQNTLDCRQSHGIESLRINWKCRQSSHWQKFQIQLWGKNHSSLHGQEGIETRKQLEKILPCERIGWSKEEFIWTFFLLLVNPLKNATWLK